MYDIYMGVYLPDMLINEALLIFVNPKRFNFFSMDGPKDWTISITPESVTFWHLLMSTLVSSLHFSAMAKIPKI